MASFFRSKTVRGVRSEVSDRVVSPDVLERLAINRTQGRGTPLIESKDRQKFNSGDPQFLEIGDLLDDASKSPRRVAARGGRPGKSTNMQLINDGLAHRPAERTVALP